MQQQRGFTLVELSIVLVIIAAIVGGIMVGRDMIGAGKINRVVTDVQKFCTAAVMFETKYGSLPGDFEKATDYWGTNANCPTGNGTTGGTCNGDGNGHIGIIDGTNQSCIEGAYAWKHLVLSGLLTGDYTGANSVGAITTCGVRAGENAPASPLGEGGAYWWWSSALPVSWFLYNDFTPNLLFLGSTLNGTNFAGYAAITPSDARNIDTKMDDGKAGLGKVQGPIATGGIADGCTTTNVATTTAYASNDSSILCSLVFLP